MDKKTFFENIRREANVALTKVFDKVEEVSKTSALKLKITSLKSQIKNYQTEIGEIAFHNKDKFKDFPEIVNLLGKIKDIEEEIVLKEEQIAELKEKEEAEEKEN
ncbi:MAG TPA: hypothetical protein ENL20_02930 [Candidatus Cloacimonetes bacterium]|nr:hypothetical protein [Candidatus Cloacimonadota bacterium]